MLLITNSKVSNSFQKTVFSQGRNQARSQRCVRKFSPQKSSLVDPKFSSFQKWKAKTKTKTKQTENKTKRSSAQFQTFPLATLNFHLPLPPLSLFSPSFSSFPISFLFLFLLFSFCPSLFLSHPCFPSFPLFPFLLPNFPTLCKCGRLALTPL